MRLSPAIRGWCNLTKLSSTGSMKKENPGIKVTEIAKKGGELWRKMKDKSEWENKAAKMKDEYNKVVQEFERNGGSKDVGSKKKSKGAKKVAKKGDDDDDGDNDSGPVAYNNIFVSLLRTVRW